MSRRRAGLGLNRARCQLEPRFSSRASQFDFSFSDEFFGKVVKYLSLRLGLGFVGLDKPKSIAKDIEIVTSARRILGADVAIGVDTDKTYDHVSALRLAPILEDNGVAWYEEPLEVNGREQ